MYKDMDVPAQDKVDGFFTGNPDTLVVSGPTSVTEMEAFFGSVSPISERVVDTGQTITSPGKSVGKVVAAAVSPILWGADEKQLCRVCGFYVRMRDHDSRCRVPTHISIKLKQLAWIGDAIWEKFIRSWVVARGRDFSEALRYVTNERLAECFPIASQVVDLGANVTLESSIHHRASFVEAALAVSPYVRLLIAKHFRVSEKYHANLWRSELILAVSDGYNMQPSFDGYCYLWFVLQKDWNIIAKRFVNYPFWDTLRDSDIPDSEVALYIRNHSGVAHMSVYPLPGMVYYKGKWKSLPFDGRTRIGTEKTENLSYVLYDIGLGGEHLSVSDRSLLTEIHVRIADVMRAGYIPFVTFRTVEKLVVIKDSQVTDVQCRGFRAAIAQLKNSIDAGMQLAFTQSSYITTSSVMTFVKITPELVADGMPLALRQAVDRRIADLEASLGTKK